MEKILEVTLFRGQDSRKDALWEELLTCPGRRAEGCPCCP